MTYPITQDDGNDSDDLQALFDSIATGAAPVPQVPPPGAALPRSVDAVGDSEELQALFDSISQTPAATNAVAPGAIADAEAQDAVFNRLGQLARQLHDSLHGLGIDKLVSDAAQQIPDTRERLAYIARMTEQAASRVLNATDIAKPIQDDLMARSQGLSQRWERMFANQLSVEEFKALATDTRAFLSTAPDQLRQTNAQLMEIMMAQDFQDLTGQVIKKMVELVHDLENQLLRVLLEAMPAQRKAEVSAGLLNGPVVSSKGRADVVSSQAQVDDLLESLGF